MIRKLVRLAPHLIPLLGVLAVGFLVAAVWTIGRTELGTTLGLAANGVALLILEWRAVGD